MKYLFPALAGLLAISAVCFCIKLNDSKLQLGEGRQAAMVAGLVGTTTDDDPTHVIVDGDEMPGIGAGVERPDTALVYFNETDRRIHIKYLAPAK